jgi:hypothetical protein
LRRAFFISEREKTHQKEAPHDGDAECATEQFLATTADRSKADQAGEEFLMPRRKVRLLEDKVSSLSTELSRRNVIGEAPHGFS